MAVSPSPGLRRVPRQARSRARVTAIINALLQEVAESDDPAAITTSDVAAKAGIAVGSLYEYFVDRRSIVHAAIEALLHEHAKIMASHSETAHDAPATATATIAAFDTLYSNQPLFLKLVRSALYEPVHEQQIADQVASLLRQGTHAAILSPDYLAERVRILISIDRATRATHDDDGLAAERNHLRRQALTTLFSDGDSDATATVAPTGEALLRRQTTIGR